MIPSKGFYEDVL